VCVGDGEREGGGLRERERGRNDVREGVKGH